MFTPTQALVGALMGNQLRKPADAAARALPSRNSAGTQRALIDIARQHFGQFGYADIALEPVTALAGLTRGALYHHFGSKTGLFCAVVDDIDQEIDNAFQAAIQARDVDDADSWQMIRIASHCYFDAVHRPDIRQIMVRDAPNHYPNFAGRQVRLRCHAKTVRALETLFTEGAFDVSNGEAAAYLIEGAVTGIVNWACDFNITVDNAKQQFDLFLSSLIKSRTSPEV